MNMFMFGVLSNMAGSVAWLCEQIYVSFLVRFRLAGSFAVDSKTVCSFVLSGSDLMVRSLAIQK